MQLREFDFRFQPVRVIDRDGEPWFVAKDVCTVLNHSNSRMAISSLDDDEKGVSKVYSPGGCQEMTIINESGLYSLVLRSNKPEAKVFKRWVTSEVLPAIRKHGGYLTPDRTEELINNPDLIIQLATSLKEERSKRERAEMKATIQSMQLTEAAPKLEFYETVLESPDTILTNVIAKELGVSARMLNRLMEHRKIIYRSGDTWVLYRKYQDKGYTKTKTYTYKGHDGEDHVSIQMVWTQKGREFIHKTFKGAT